MPFEEEVEIPTPFTRSASTSVFTTGPKIEPPTLTSNPILAVSFVSVEPLNAKELPFEKVKDDPFSIVAELFAPGGSRNTKSGICGPAVTNVWVPSDVPPNRIPSVL